MDRILHDANNAQRILKLTADTMLLVDRHGVCVAIEPHLPDCTRRTKKHQQELQAGAE